MSGFGRPLGVPTQLPLKEVPARATHGTTTPRFHASYVVWTAPLKVGILNPMLFMETSQQASWRCSAWPRAGWWKEGRGKPEEGLIFRGLQEPPAEEDYGVNGAGGEHISWGPSCEWGCHMHENLVAMGTGLPCPPSPAVNGVL